MVETTMSEIEHAEQVERRVVGVLTAVLIGSVIAIPFVAERLHRRWWRENEPFAELRLGLARARSGVQRQREGASDLGHLVTDIISGL
jgi:hypothetical protein